MRSSQHVDDLPPITSAPAMARRWREMLGDGGSIRRELWVAVLDGDHRQMPLLPVLDDLPAGGDPVGAAQIARFLAQLAAEAGGVHLALALSRPGRSSVRRDDEAWARELRTALGRLGVPLLSIHLATGSSVQALGGAER